MKKAVLLSVAMALGGCGQLGLQQAAAPSQSSEQLRPQARPDGSEVVLRPPPDTARTVEEFDTTTAEERAAASAPADVAREQSLGGTIVSLGDPARPGFWLETPLVSTSAMGRVAYSATGQSAQVELIPIDGPATAGSRMSLAAMRLLGVPLTGLVEVQVFSGG